MILILDLNLWSLHSWSRGLRNSLRTTLAPCSTRTISCSPLLGGTWYSFSATGLISTFTFTGHQSLSLSFLLISTARRNLISSYATTLSLEIILELIIIIEIILELVIHSTPVTERTGIQELRNRVQLCRDFHTVLAKVRSKQWLWWICLWRWCSSPDWSGMVRTIYVRPQRTTLHQAFFVAGLLIAFDIAFVKIDYQFEIYKA